MNVQAEAITAFVGQKLLANTYVCPIVSKIEKCNLF